MPKVTKAPAIEVGSKVTFEHEGDEITAEVTKLKGKTAVCEDDENGYEVPIKELTLVEEDDDEKPAKKVKAKAKDDDDDDDDDDKPKKKKGKGQSLAEMLNDTEKAELNFGIPNGDWDALIVDAKLESNEKGDHIWMEYVCTDSDDKDAYGKSSRKMFFLRDENGNALKGAAYFKTDLATLGHDDVEFDDDDDIVKLLKAIKKEQPWVEIQVVPRTDQPQYSNIRLQNLKDDQDEKPDLADIPY